MLQFNFAITRIIAYMLKNKYCINSIPRTEIYMEYVAFLSEFYPSFDEQHFKEQIQQHLNKYTLH